MTRWNIRHDGVARVGAPQLAAALALGACAVVASAQEEGQRILQTQRTAVEQSNQSSGQEQTQIDEMYDQQLESADQYAVAIAEAEALEIFNDALREQVLEQRAEIRSLEEQLGKIEQTNRAVAPLMTQMLHTLERWVELDVPFLMDIRRGRVAELKAIMQRADVPNSEKYRKLLEAYLAELEYGRTFDSYDGLLGEGADARAVVFVRLGRVSLMYRTLDGSEVGYWNAATRNWNSDNSYSAAIEQALRVARKIGAAELVTVPVPAPQEDRS